jgi:hypothetical protein
MRRRYPPERDFGRHKSGPYPTAKPQKLAIQKPAAACSRKRPEPGPKAAAMRNAAAKITRGVDHLRQPTG